MLPIPQHLENSLRELQQHYLSLKEDYTNQLQLVKTQLFHVDSLLSGTIPPPPNLAQNIQELQEYYRCVESELVALELEIIAKLSHVEALVGEGRQTTINLLPNGSPLGPPELNGSATTNLETSVPLPEQHLLSESESEPVDCFLPRNATRLQTVEELQTVLELQTVEELPLPIEPSHVEGPPSPEIPNKYSAQSFIKTLHVNTQSAFKDYTKNGGGITISEIDGIPTLKITVTSDEYNKRVQSRIDYYNEQFNRWLGSHASTPLSTRGNIIVETLSRRETTKFSVEVVTSSDDRLKDTIASGSAPDAIAQLLKDNQGTILHIDFIVRSLYGTMSRDDTNRVTKNTLQILNDGVKNGNWDVDPDNPNCYTINYLSIIS